MRTLTWYFDFISPFAYLQIHNFDGLGEGVSIDYRPVLLAGLLGHWGNKGPAEIPGKRLFTYRHVAWLAQRADIPLRFPPAHPFNPLRALRLCIALGCTGEVVQRIFAAIWEQGLLPSNDADWRRLCSSMGSADADELISRAEVKQTLRDNTEQAARQGVFGVPTFAADDKLFFGADATEMLLDYLRDRTLFDSPQMRRIETLPYGDQRKP